RVVEPLLTLDKTHSAMGLTVDAGDTVTYTATITNDGGAPTNSTATAFDIEFADTPPVTYLTLNLASVAISTSGGAAGVVNASAGNTVRLTIASMPVGSQVVITYQVDVSAAVTPGQAIDNDAEVIWTSLPGPQGTGDATPGLPGTGNGERDGSDGPAGNPNDHDLTDIATLDVRDPVFSKSLESTSAVHTAGNNLAIGEVATFGLIVTLPEGTIPGFRVEDEIPDGLSYVDGSMILVTQTSPPASCGSLAADFNGTLPAPTLTVTPPGGGSGADLAFDFGPATVVDDNITNNDSFLICFEAVLLNEAGNQASPPPLTNVGNLVLGTDSFTDSLDVAVVEPALQIAKSVDDPNPTPGQIITFTVVVDHAPSSGADAFDVEISDSLPADLTLDTASIAISPSGGLVNVVNGSAGNVVYISVDAFPLGASLTITYSASVNASFGTTINNTAGTVWTSLPGTDAEERTGADGPGGALNDYAAGSVVPLVANRDLVKSLVADSHPAPVTALPEVTIGEILTYQLVITVPPSSSDTYAVVDTLDSGLAFVDCETITGGPDLTSSTVSLNAAGNCVPGTGGGSNPLIADAGATVTFDFGTVANADAVNAESITIRYRAVVLDTTANVGGVELYNEARMDWSLGTISRQTSPVTIVEPDVGLEKAVDSPSATPFTILTYQIRIFHTAGSGLPAYDAVIDDILPDGIEYIPGSLAFVAGSGVAPTVLDDTNVDPVSGNPVMHAEWSILPLGGESVIEFQAELQPINLGVTITNTATAEWTSLPGDVPAPPATYLSAFNQPYSHERRYDPLFPADVYRIAASAAVTHPLLPDTGFAPGKITDLPAPPAGPPYVQLNDMRLYIPRLGRSLSVVGVPLGEEGWDLNWLWDQAGYLEGTAFPGSPGNSVITAHVYLPNGQTGPFIGLGNLRWGDKLILWLGAQRFVYEVRTNTKVLPTDITPFRHEESPWLTLVTCLGYDPWSDTYRYRQIVRAVLVDVS
ncbi:MAG: isopeptide-forming domain-containing fimbrial protein, partial [Anaerolineales bacterium]